ncbi:UNVERIFIED_CONTAM: hypothetical protein FKN15_001379 [Acipenser sinensis]
MLRVKRGVLLLILLATLSSAADVKCYCSSNFPKPCSKPNFLSWYKVGSSCVKYFSTPMTFAHAESYCRDQVSGGHLVVIDSEATNERISCITNKYNDHRTWVGGFHLFKSQKYIWTDGSKWNYSNWAPGEPNNQNNKEDCIEINYNGPGKWNDHDCNSKMPFICAFKSPEN